MGLVCLQYLFYPEFYKSTVKDPSKSGQSFFKLIVTGKGYALHVKKLKINKRTLNCY